MDTKESGRLGGQRRAAKLTPQQRSAIARHAALARWAKVGAEERSETLRTAVIARWQRAKNLDAQLPAPPVIDVDRRMLNRSREASVVRLRAIVARAQFLSSAHKALPFTELRNKAQLLSELLLLVTEFIETNRLLDARVMGMQSPPIN